MSCVTFLGIEHNWNLIGLPSTLNDLLLVGVVALETQSYRCEVEAGAVTLFAFNLAQQVVLNERDERRQLHNQMFSSDAESISSISVCVSVCVCVCVSFPLWKDSLIQFGCQRQLKIKFVVKDICIENTVNN